MMYRRDTRDTVAIVLLGLVALVGGLGHGLHALVGCWHPLATCLSAAPGPSALMRSPHAPAPNLASANHGVLAAGGFRAKTSVECPVCALLAGFQAVQQRSLIVAASDVVSSDLRYAPPPLVAATWLESCRPRGPPPVGAALI